MIGKLIFAEVARAARRGVYVDEEARVPGRWDTAIKNACFNNTIIGLAVMHQARLNKESALRPQESQKTAIERQVRELDQTIDWLEKFE